MSAKQPEKTTSKAWLENAYDLITPQDNRDYYQGFASAYDADFAKALGYCYPRIIAETYLGQATPKDTPIADIGCGTGLVAEALPPTLAIDGFDISPDMLAAAQKKDRYQNLHEVDITTDLSQFPARYGAIISAGTFTHGHLGPEPLRELLNLALPGGLFVIGVNQQHYQALGFGDVLHGMLNDALITEPSLKESRIYDAVGHEHASDLALVVVFRKQPKGA